ncbi:MAG TPA: hypothetical protein H9737_06220 [Candidatus Borkfalkia faecigallinarum]|uniref:Uncharacterized protein n=1 Tax=Candidatus Borkfalkia faecigallinarum TaxID=2838509 RepID=A0A9D1VUM2_9FIRM|nr:hypothetical protein [Candidatus Borkfalkia faecigallinarum]
MVHKNNFVPTKLFFVRNSCKYNHTYLKNFLEKSKIALLDFSPDLPQGFWEKGEFAAFIKGVPLKHAAKREKPPPSKANGGVALKITEKSFISLKLFS